MGIFNNYRSDELSSEFQTQMRQFIFTSGPEVLQRSQSYSRYVKSSESSKYSLNGIRFKLPSPQDTTHNGLNYSQAPIYCLLNRGYGKDALLYPFPCRELEGRISWLSQVNSLNPFCGHVLSTTSLLWAETGRPTFNKQRGRP